MRGFLTVAVLLAITSPAFAAGTYVLRNVNDISGVHTQSYYDESGVGLGPFDPVMAPPADFALAASQAQIVVTSASGTFSGTWSKAFKSATPYVVATPISSSSAQAAVCNVASTTATTFSGICFITQPTTISALGSTISSVVVDPLASVRVFATDLTQ